MELIKQLPEEHSGLIKLIKKNYKRIDFDKLKPFNSESEIIEVQTFYMKVINDIFSSRSESIELLLDLSVINTEIETNIDKASIKASHKLSNFENIFNRSNLAY